MTQDTLLPSNEPFSVGRVLNVSISLYLRNFVPLTITAAVISIPYIVVQTWSDLRTAQGSSAGTWPSIVQAVTFSLVQAAMVFGAFQDQRGEQVKLGACLSRAMDASGKVIRGALLYSLAILVGTLLLIVPGIILYVMWWVYVPAIVIEGLGVSASFRRSKELTAGRRWQIFGLLAVVTVVELGIILGMVVVLPNVTGSILTTVLAVLFNALSGVMTAVGYYYLRVEKEGIGVDEIAKVFD